MTRETYASAVSEFITRKHDITTELDARARTLFFDFWAVAEAGARSDSALAALSSIATSLNSSDLTSARIIGHDAWASPTDAALVNGISAHSLELDDTFEPASLHPAVVVFPALLAASESREVSWNSLATAALVGYEVMCAVGLDSGAAATYARGFHPTGVSGTIGAAAAVARIRKLTPEQTTHALGLAANMASGSLEFLSDGSWTKRLNAGNAAASAVRAVQLAAAGYTAPTRSFEGRDGFFHQYGTDAPKGLDVDLEFGRHAEATSLKFYPCCRYMHGVMDLLVEIHDERPDLTVGDVASIRAGVLSAGAGLVAMPAEKKLDVRTAVDAQFSMPFGAALTLMTGAATVTDFENAAELTTKLLPVMRTVDCYTSDALEDAFPQQWGAEVEVTLTDGTHLSRQSSAFYGSATKPASLEDIHAKAAGLVGAIRSGQMWSFLSTLSHKPMRNDWITLDIP